MEGGGGGGGLGTMRAVLAILQWWGFNVTVIIINKWIFQVPPLSHLPSHGCHLSPIGDFLVITLKELVSLQVHRFIILFEEQFVR
jgi:hypothetical protein